MTAQSKQCLAMSKLNKQSAKAGGSWLVDAWQPRVENYEFIAKGGKTMKGSNFTVILVSAENPSEYLFAQIKKTQKNAAAFEKAVNVIKNGKRYVMSKVAFTDSIRAQYNSCTIKHVVDLASSKMEPSAESPTSVVQPVPITTVAGSPYAIMIGIDLLSH